MEQKRYFCILQDVAGRAVWLRWIDGDIPSVWIIALDGDTFDYQIFKNARMQFDGSTARFEDSVNIKFNKSAGNFVHGTAVSKVFVPSKKYRNVFLDSVAEGVVKIHGSELQIRDSHAAVSYASGEMSKLWQWKHEVNSNSVTDSVAVPVCGRIWISSVAALQKRNGGTTGGICIGRNFRPEGLKLEDAIQIAYPGGVSSYTFLFRDLDKCCFTHYEVGGRYEISCKKKIDCSDRRGIFTG